MDIKKALAGDPKKHDGQVKNFEEFVSCRTCRGTGVIDFAEISAVINCPWCGSYYASYIVRPHVWKAAGLHPRSHACLTCLARKLKRALTPDDFDLRIPINQGIRLGIEMGKKK